MEKVEIRNTVNNNGGTKKYIVGISLVVILELTSVIDINTTFTNIVDTISKEYIRLYNITEKASRHLDRKE
jgi:hypothetical protein